MISIPKDEFQQIFVKDLMISSEKVAHVQIGNGLEHALLVLVNLDIRRYLFWTRCTNCTG